MMAHSDTPAPAVQVGEKPLDSDSSAPGTRKNSDASEWKASKNTILVFVPICVLTLMVALDGTSIGVALPTIAEALDGSAIETFWSGTSFLLASTVLQPTFASLSSIFGRRRLFLVSLAFFFAGSLVACLAKSFTVLLVGRTLQGVGGGGIMTIDIVVITDLVPLAHRAQWYGITNAMWSIGSVTGPILGGGFAGSGGSTWRWIFYINFPFIAIGAVLAAIYMRLSLPVSSFRSKLQRIDFVGAFLFTASTTIFLIPLTWGGVLYSWSSAPTLVPLLLGVATAVVFVLYETYFTAHPMIPIGLFRSPTVLISFVGTIVSGLVLWCVLYYLPLYFLAVKGYTTVISGVALFPQTLTVAPCAILSGVLIAKTGGYRWALWLGWSVTTLGLGLFCVLKPSTSVPGWIFLNVVSGLGLGFLFPAMATAVQAAVVAEEGPGGDLATPVPSNEQYTNSMSSSQRRRNGQQDHVVMAVAMFAFFRSLGQALGVAVGGVVFQNRMKANLAAYPALAGVADEYSADAAGLVQVIRAMDDGSQDRDDLKTAYTDSLRTVWIVCCALAGAAGLLSLLTKGYKLGGGLKTDQGVIEAPARGAVGVEAGAASATKKVEK